MTPYYLIDFENVQPKMLTRLEAGNARIKVFLGQNQTKLMLDLVQALQPFGADAEYIPINGSGPDAVDFHIAFYIGRLASAEPGVEFTIISKDKGFDPLVKHLASLGIACRRAPEIPGVPAISSNKPAVIPAPAKMPVAKTVPGKVAKTSMPATARSRAKAVVDHLKGSTKPATVAKLRSTIRAYFHPPLDDKALDAVLQSLQDSKKISVSGTKVTYVLA